MTASEVKSRTVWVYDPVAEARQRQDALAPRHASLDGKVIGLLDNTKDLVEILLGEARNVLQAEYPGAVFRYFRKPSVSGVEPDMMEQVAACGAVVTAVGD